MRDNEDRKKQIALNELKSNFDAMIETHETLKKKFNDLMNNLKWLRDDDTRPEPVHPHYKEERISNILN